MSLEYVSTLLRAAEGVTGHADAPLRQGGTVPVSFRTAPSAGGLYPLDVYLLAQNVKSLPRRVYRHIRHPDALIPVGVEGTADSVLGAFATNEDMISLTRSNVIMLIVAQPWRVMRKYGQRGMRFVFMECGSVAQNLNIAAVALGYGSVECASVYDDDMNSALELDGVFRSYIHSVVIGYAA